MMLFWAWILLAFDIWSFFFGCIYMCDHSSKKAYEKIHFLNSVSIPYSISRIIWGYRIYKYWDIFNDISNISTISGIVKTISAIEVGFSLFTIVIVTIESIFIIADYTNSLKYGRRCPLKLFLKTYKILDYQSDNYNIQYHCDDINFSFFSYLIACELLYKEKSKNKKSNKRKEIRESQKELYSIMVSDLQKIQRENEEKAKKYFSQAEQTAKKIQKNLDSF